MTGLLCVPVVLSLVLLAAHASRAGLPLGVALLLLAPAVLLAVPRRWAARSLQAVLVAGALEWVRTAAVLVAARHAADMPATRLAVILAAVALLTAASALVFRHARLRRRFGLD